MSTDSIHRQAELIKALANPVRLRVLQQLRKGECTATDLVRSCHISKANLSQHINQLKNKGVVVCIKRGTFCHYSLADARVTRALDLLDAIVQAPARGAQTLNSPKARKPARVRR